MVIMATTKEYFSYAMRGGCGFPSFTLHGEAADWEMILTRLDRFAEYGAEPGAWSKLLQSVIKRFIATFYLPESKELKKFWMHANHSEGEWGSSSPAPTFDGWLTAFMYWDKNGERVYEAPKKSNDRKPFRLDCGTYPILYQSMLGVPTGFVQVPVVVETYDLHIRFDTRIVAGSMGVTLKDHQGAGMTVQPCPG